MSMLRALMEMRGHSLRAIDKDLGAVEDFYFDDRLWKVRYLVVDTGNWLPGREVLIAPEELDLPNWEEKVFPIKLTSTEIENSPGIESDLPFSLQKEHELRLFFKWREYWNDNVFIEPTGFRPIDAPGPQAVQPPEGRAAKTTPRLNGNPHLRSANEVQGYYILSQNGEIGHVDDFVINETTWEIRYLVVDTRNWLPGKKVLISPRWVNVVDWNSQSVELDMTKEHIEESPEFTPGEPISREYEVRLYQHYGKPHDWE